MNKITTIVNVLIEYEQLGYNLYLESIEEIINNPQSYNDLSEICTIHHIDINIILEYIFFLIKLREIKGYQVLDPYCDYSSF